LKKLLTTIHGKVSAFTDKDLKNAKIDTSLLNKFVGALTTYLNYIYIINNDSYFVNEEIVDENGQPTMGFVRHYYINDLTKLYKVN
jgi:hypothetical protein